MAQYFSREGLPSLSVEQITENANRKNSTPFSSEEVNSILEELREEQKIYIDEDGVTML